MTHRTHWYADLISASRKNVAREVFGAVFGRQATVGAHTGTGSVLQVESGMAIDVVGVADYGLPGVILDAHIGPFGLGLHDLDAQVW